MNINPNLDIKLKSSPFAGSTKITSESIKKRFKDYEPWQVIAELVWNGLDAGASKVDILVQEKTLKGMESVSVLDNGTGIDFENTDKNFERFDDTTKKDVSQHGSHGRGHLSFHLIASNATWYTRCKGQDALMSRNVSKNSFFIESRLNENINKGEPGLVSSGHEKFKMYAKNWHTIFNEFTL